VSFLIDPRMVDLRQEFHRRCFEWEVWGQDEVKFKGPAFVWAIGGGCDCAFPLENVLFQRVDREALDGVVLELLQFLMNTSRIDGSSRSTALE